MSHRFASAAIASLVVISALAFTIPTGFVSAVDTHTWDGGGWPDHKASTATNWVGDSLPEAGDNLLWDATNTSICTFDLALAFGSLTIGAGYTGTGVAVITQGASFSVTSFSMAAGTFTGSTSYTLTCSGNFVFSGTILTAHLLKLVMTGSAITVLANTYFDSLTINNNLTVTAPTTGLTVNSVVTVASGKTLTIAAGSLLVWKSYGTSFTNSGILAGTGTFKILAYSADKTMTFGVVNCPVYLQLLSTSAGSQTITVGAATTLGSTLTVDSADAAKTMTLDLSASNYALSAAGITIGTRGIINGRGSQIIDTGIWNSQNGTFTKGTSTVHLTGTSKNLWMESGGMFNNLIIPSGASYTLRTAGKTYNLWKNGTFTTTGKAFYVNNNQAPTIDTLPSPLRIPYYEDYSYDVNATDRENQSQLVYVMTSDLPGLSINATTGVISISHNIENGTFYIHITVSDGNHTAYQNYTLVVSPLDAKTNALVILGLTLLIAFGLTLIGLKRREFWIMAGPVWIVSGLTVFEPYGILFLFTGIGLGIALLYEGVMSNV